MAKRGRPAKTRDDSAASPPPIHNLTDGELYSRTNEKRVLYERFLAAKKKADADFKNCCKEIKQLLGDTAIDDIKGLIALSTPEGEIAAKAEVERQIRVMRWMQVPIGTHGELFPEIDAAPITERAFNSGRRQGLAGESQNNPHHHTNPAHQAHNDGYADGQTVLATNGFKPIDGCEVSPSKAWLDQTREQNEAVERAIKSGTIDSLTQN